MADPPRFNAAAAFVFLAGWLEGASTPADAKARPPCDYGTEEWQHWTAGFVRGRTYRHAQDMLRLRDTQP